MEEPPRQKRQVALKVRVKELLDGEYVKEEGWMPNFIRTISGKKVSRANIIGAVVIKSEEQNRKSIVLDDGSGKIPVRSFEEEDHLDSINIGDIVLIIGRPREFGEKYIVPEVVRKIDNPLWVEVRKLELDIPEVKEIREEPIIATNQISTEESIVDENPTQKIFGLIKQEDSGSGVDVEEIIKKSNITEAEKIIKNLLEEGEIFELRPGIVKVLE